MDTSIKTSNILSTKLNYSPIRIKIQTNKLNIDSCSSFILIHRSDSIFIRGEHNEQRQKHKRQKVY